MFDTSVDFDQDLDALEYGSLLQVAKTFRQDLQECRNDNRKLEGELRHIQTSNRVLSFPSSISSADVPPYWIRAELDCPTETSWSCFGGRRNKYSTVIVYDQSLSTLEARNRDSIKSEPAGIYSRFPSRWCNTFYVFVESTIATSSTSGFQKKFWVSAKKNAPSGFIPHCTVHLKRLSWSTRLKIRTGRIKWLYILRSADQSRKEELA